MPGKAWHSKHIIYLGRRNGKMANTIVPVEIIATKIVEIRDKKVMIDRDLAMLYGVETRQLTRQVRRNLDRFPQDFMFQLTKSEFINLMCQIGTSSWGGTRKLPYVFTEQGVAMLSSVLNSKRAIRVNIQIMRAFIKLKELPLTHKELAVKIDKLERQYADHDEKIQQIFEAIRQLLQPTRQAEKRIIGFGRE
jgi:hypothetical protein